ncbi:hypothetical protein V3F56_10520 [Moorellaceae bacterium AZ2]
MVHGGLSASLWAYTKGVCWLCAIFLILETALFLAIVLAPPKRGRVRLLGSTMVALFLGSVFLLAINPAPPLRMHDSNLTVASELLSGTQLKVSTVDGLPVTLDLRNKPALIWSLWCPQCREKIEVIARFPPELRPYLVLVPIFPTTDIHTARAWLVQKGLSSETVYVLTEPKVKVTPLLLFWDQKTETVLAR